MGKYLESLTKDKAVVEAEQFAQTDAEQALQLDSDILATQKALTSAKRKVNTLKSAVPLSGAAIIDALDEVASLEKGLTMLKELKNELFS